MCPACRQTYCTAECAESFILFTLFTLNFLSCSPKSESTNGWPRHVKAHIVSDKHTELLQQWYSRSGAKLSHISLQHSKSTLTIPIDTEIDNNLRKKNKYDVLGGNYCLFGSNMTVCNIPRTQMDSREADHAARVLMVICCYFSTGKTGHIWNPLIDIKKKTFYGHISSLQSSN